MLVFINNTSCNGKISMHDSSLISAATICWAKQKRLRTKVQTWCYQSITATVVVFLLFQLANILQLPYGVRYCVWTTTQTY